MLTLLTGKRQKAIAWFLFVLFYAEMAGSVYASTRAYYIPATPYHYYNSPVLNNNNNNRDDLPPVISATLIDKKAAKDIKVTQPFVEAALLNSAVKTSSPEKNNGPEKADIGGPGQPEMSTFKSVGADNMVNLFTGDFSYNIPLLDVDGYPINIFYNGGPTMDQEASWVGLGWNINPGTINRNMRGLPDDFDKDEVIKEQSTKPDITVGVTAGLAVEAVGYPVGGSATAGVFHNSKRGVGLELGVSGEFKAQVPLSQKTTDDKNSLGVGLGVGINLGSQTGLEVTPSVSFSFQNQLTKGGKRTETGVGLSTSVDFNSRAGLGDLRLSGEYFKNKTERYNLDCETYWVPTKGSSSTSLFSTSISFARSAYTPSIRMPITNFNATFSAKLGYELFPVTFTGSITGYYTKSAIASKDNMVKKKAVGFMYAEEAMDDKNYLMDFNRLNDGTYTVKTPVISVPVYTYDVFTITGEGTGGSFRGYRGNMGYVRDAYSRTNSGRFNLGLDLGATQTVKVGATIGGVYSATKVGAWETENVLKHAAAFKASEGIVQKGFYFKNPGEKAIIDEQYYNNMGGDKLMRPMFGSGPAPGLPYNQPTVRLQNRFQLFNSKREADGTTDLLDDKNSFRQVRDKRTQVISYLTNFEAKLAGLDEFIYSYQENVFKPGMCKKNPGVNMPYRTPIERYPTGADVTGGYRQQHHISEITVQQGSQRYIYGLPVYQKMQKEVSFSTGETAPDAKGLIGYTSGDENSTGNMKGKDWLFQSETVPAYPHSFLLTAILSPDYSDITGDGISDDDLGTAIKFNYSKANKVGTNSWKDMNWRLPVEKEKANFNRALVTDKGDNMGSYSYGSKELWYTHSIESKNMIATFTVSNRNDGWGVENENGGMKNGAAGGACQKKLDRIDLYSKADFIKYGTNAKPIKSVYFKYTYSLCKDYILNDGVAVDEDGNDPGTTGKPNINTRKGKLTLKTIYFTYNKNTHQKNKYRFKYADEESNTAVYNAIEHDRWGTYKPHAQNPGTIPLSNEDYPYANQDQAQADANAAAWNLNQVLLPSGAKIDVSYEADDYAYVQNRRAAQMTSILGFGELPTSTPEPKLYNRANLHAPWDFSHVDYKCIFFNAPVHVFTEADVRRVYLQDLKQLLLKLWVKVPKDGYGEGYEPIFVYCTIKSCGMKPGSNGSQFYIEVGDATRHNGSQIMETVYQFLREQMPSKAYPGYDVGNSSAVGQLAKALFAMANNIRTGTMGFENSARFDGWCKEVILANSFARLCNPDLKKRGGGYRVKSVKITDNFKRMLEKNPNDPDISSVYGQEYNYSTTEVINGQSREISNGVASYEPGVGNEENPFREMYKYNNTNPLAPTSNGNIELPVAEMFFPAASVGYSRVTVKSIHNKTNKNIKSAVGMQETLFYTTKDFPVLNDFTDFDPASRHQYKPNAISQIFNFAKKNYMTLSQGFRVMLNDMNGKVKMQSSYAETDLNNPISKTTYHYRMTKTGENKNTLDNLLPVISGADGKITNKLIGKDIEVMNDFREHFTFTHSLQIPLNLDFFTLGAYPVLLPSLFRSIFRDESMYRSATTLKVVNQFGILDSIEVMDKGSIVGTKNLVYDAETGEVLLSRTNNEFNKPIYNFSYPAYWANKGMGPAYKNIDAVFKGLVFRNGKIEAGLSESEANDIFESGDEIYVMDRSNTDVKDNAACIAANGSSQCTLLPKSDQYRIWALDITKDSRNTVKEFIFIDRYGKPYNANKADIRIIRSGCRNMTDAAVGSITSMANPIVHDNINNRDKIFIDNATEIVNTGAIEFKEKWKTQDIFYIIEQGTVINRLAPLHTLNATPIASSEFINYRYFDPTPVGFPFPHPRGWVTDRPYRYNNDNFFTRNYTLPGLGPKYSSKGWLQFNLSAINPGKTIKSAKLSIPAHKDIKNDKTTILGTDFHLYLERRPYSPPKYPFFAHTDWTPQFSLQGDNIFSVKRMLTQWPGNNSGAWRTMFENPGYADAATQALGGPTPAPFGTDYSWCTNCGPGHSDNRLNVTSLVKNMLLDRDNPAKQYGTFLQVEMLRYNEQVRAVCFNSGLNQGNPNFPKPTLTIDYYDCAEAYGLPGNPTGPPPGQATTICSTIQPQTTCYSVFDKDYINPYVLGLLGNFRPLRSFVYNGERREQVLAPPPTVNGTKISKDGIIKDFETFWTLAAENIPDKDKIITRTNLNSSKWVWNSEITQYNRKGAELENVDPLGRYNTGIYGYNEALPVAVVNNSKLRLSAYDGFEDYFFKDQSCELTCKPNKRHFDTKINTTQLDETESHTGRYSFKTNANSSSEIKIKISADNNINEPDIKIQLNKSTANIPVVTLQGTGLRGTYRNCTFFSMNNCSLAAIIDNDMVNINNVFPPGVHDKNTRALWEGKLQVEESGEYNFDFVGDVNDGGDIWIDLGSGGQKVHEQEFSNIRSHTPVSLVAGQSYNIAVGFYQTGGDFFINLGWKRPCETISNLIPRLNLYMPGATVGPVVTGPVICTKVEQIKALSNYLIDEFNLIADKKMIASVWVKKGTTDCRCPLYEGFSIKLRNSSNADVALFAPKGPIIEGWQLFETEFDVPAGSEMNFYIANNNSNQPLFIDDLRFHPYNANMKSFVYNPYNLKPAAELDENNYASFYEYDDDGTLIRVKKETKLGIKTIQETRSGLQKTVTDF
jgi:hypothetical protein